MKYRMDRMVEKQDETVDQVRGLREDHAERMEWMEKEIAEIKAKIGLLEESRNEPAP